MSGPIHTPFATEMRCWGWCRVIRVEEMEHGGQRGWLRKEGGAAAKGTLRAALHPIRDGNKVQGVV